jgi:hypothetical protein
MDVVSPRRVKTMLNPTTKKKLERNTRGRILSKFRPYRSLKVKPVIIEKYEGSKGKRHGEKKAVSPAIYAVIKEMF